MEIRSKSSQNRFINLYTNAHLFWKILSHCLFKSLSYLFALNSNYLSVSLLIQSTAFPFSVCLCTLCFSLALNWLVVFMAINLLLGQLTTTSSLLPCFSFLAFPLHCSLYFSFLRRYSLSIHAFLLNFSFTAFNIKILAILNYLILIGHTGGS